ncbi:MAG: hypothetical protein ACRDP9_11100, partial [Kribbellaceae bacterium]
MLTPSLRPAIATRSFASVVRASFHPSLLANVDEHTPDFFVIHGRNDTLAPVHQARDFVAALREWSDATVTYA